MSALTAEILVKGRATRVAAADLHGLRVVCAGSWLKTARIFDEAWLEQPAFRDPRPMIEAVRQSPLAADVFTFGESLPAEVPLDGYAVEHESLAVASTIDFEAWWQSLPHESRKNVRKCEKRGVRVEPAAFTDELVRGIKAIYDETPIRQGRRFWHYGKPLEAVRRENSSYLNRSQFIGAWLGDELIGFVKFVYSGDSARIMQILAKEEHYAKHPTNALLAAAVEACARRPARRLIYGQYIYGRKRGSSVTEFKRRNGFHELLVPHYHVPFTARGRFAIAAGLCRGIGARMPEPILNLLLASRGFAYRKLASRLRLIPSAPRST